MGFAIAAYPLTLLSASIKAMRAALASLQTNGTAEQHLMPFADLRRTVGFDAYFVRPEKRLSV